MKYINLIKENMPQPREFQDVYAFSVHKCGSSLMYGMISEICKRSGIPGISIPDLLFNNGFFDNEWQSDDCLVNLLGIGRVYYGFRYLPDFFKKQNSHLKGKKSVLLIRDPRDALVSMYYSFGGKYISHALPKINAEKLLTELKKNSVLDIDDYVLQEANILHAKLDNYKNYLDFDHVLLYRYEEAYFDKKEFLKKIFSHFALDVASEILTEVAVENDIRPTIEDPTKHIRKGTPGDHREKLRPSTITQLNDIFRETCQWYGYDF